MKLIFARTAVLSMCVVCATIVVSLFAGVPSAVYAQDQETEGRPAPTYARRWEQMLQEQLRPLVPPKRLQRIKSIWKQSHCGTDAGERSCGDIRQCRESLAGLREYLGNSVQQEAAMNAPERQFLEDQVQYLDQEYDLKVCDNPNATLEPVELKSAGFEIEWVKFDISSTLPIYIPKPVRRESQVTARNCYYALRTEQSELARLQGVSSEAAEKKIAAHQAAYKKLQTTCLEVAQQAKEVCYGQVQYWNIAASKDNDVVVKIQDQLDKLRNRLASADSALKETLQPRLEALQQAFTTNTEAVSRSQARVQQAKNECKPWDELAKTAADQEDKSVAGRLKALAATLGKNVTDKLSALLNRTKKEPTPRVAARGDNVPIAPPALPVASQPFLATYGLYGDELQITVHAREDAPQVDQLTVQFSSSLPSGARVQQEEDNSNDLVSDDTTDGEFMNQIMAMGGNLPEGFLKKYIPQFQKIEQLPQAQQDVAMQKIRADIEQDLLRTSDSPSVTPSVPTISRTSPCTLKGNTLTCKPGGLLFSQGQTSFIVTLENMGSLQGISARASLTRNNTFVWGNALIREDSAAASAWQSASYQDSAVSSQGDDTTPETPEEPQGDPVLIIN